MQLILKLDLWLNPSFMKTRTVSSREIDVWSFYGSRSFPSFLVGVNWSRIPIENCGTQDSRVEKGL